MSVSRSLSYSCSNLSSSFYDCVSQGKWFTLSVPSVSPLEITKTKTAQNVFWLLLTDDRPPHPHSNYNSLTPSLNKHSLRASHLPSQDVPRRPDPNPGIPLR